MTMTMKCGAEAKGYGVIIQHRVDRAFRKAHFEKSHRKKCNNISNKQIYAQNNCPAVKSKDSSTTSGEKGGTRPEVNISRNCQRQNKTGSNIIQSDKTKQIDKPNKGPIAGGSQSPMMAARWQNMIKTD